MGQFVFSVPRSSVVVISLRDNRRDNRDDGASRHTNGQLVCVFLLRDHAEGFQKDLHIQP